MRSRPAVVALHEPGDRLACRTPLGLVAQDDRVRAETRQLGHRRHDEIVLELASSAPVEGASDEIAPDDVVGRRPVSNPDPRPLAQALEVVVITDRMPVMVGHVAWQILAQARRGCVLEPTVVAG